MDEKLRNAIADAVSRASPMKPFDLSYRGVDPVVKSAIEDDYREWTKPNAPAPDALMYKGGGDRPNEFDEWFKGGGPQAVHQGHYSASIDEYPTDTLWTHRRFREVFGRDPDLANQEDYQKMVDLFWPGGRPDSKKWAPQREYMLNPSPELGSQPDRYGELMWSLALRKALKSGNKEDAMRIYNMLEEGKGFFGM